MGGLGFGSEGPARLKGSTSSFPSLSVSRPPPAMVVCFSKPGSDIVSHSDLIGGLSQAGPCKTYIL